ncbi:DUF2280 domain-containing protein [Paracoccus benzoatiresistens]|uniref:DUF2280 domain-containing protein n=1 Tax=Paracoccus benzoatiresistens TaxID=2997341 RepID=A0ABT4JB80_9RHOB|nr:DUF2280 domain-containing protein [Paracoccus sp. EF6]MCZ0964315.1 DUF2280 domain-containing protein [Paracoccus sp. EF6]
MAGAKLNNEVRTFIVQALACFDGPSAVVKAVEDEFRITIARQSVEAYDPTKRAGRDLATKWRTIFEETRTAFLEDTSKIGISHRAVRLRALQRMAEKAETQGNMVLASSLLEQAAKEMGGAFTNRREVTGKEGGALEVKTLADFYADLPRPDA